MPCGPFEDVAYHGVKGALWTLREFAQRDLMRHIFAGEDQTGVLEFALHGFSETSSNLKPYVILLACSGIEVQGANITSHSKSYVGSSLSW